MHTAIKYLGLPALTGLLILALTAFATFEQQRADRHIVQTSFNADAEQVATRLQQSFAACTQLLQGVQSVSGGATDVSRDSFTRYVTAQFATSGCAGASSINLAALVVQDQRDAFVQTQRQLARNDFAITPGGARSLYAPVIASTASSGGRVLPVGTDPLANPDRQRTLNAARDTGRPALSGKLTVTTADGTNVPGFMLAAPVFATDKPHTNIDERRSNLIGWVMLDFALADWLHSSLGEQDTPLKLTILGNNGEGEDPHIFGTGTRSQGKAAEALETTRTLGPDEHGWTLQLSAPSDYARAHAMSKPIPTAIAGALLALLVAIICLTLTHRRIAAAAAAETASAALQESEERWRFALEGAGDGVWDWNVGSGAIHFSPRCDVILGMPTQGSAAARIHPEDEAPERAAMQACLEGKSNQYASEHRMQGEDEQWRWISARGMVLSRAPDGRAQHMIGTITDITERKTAAERLNTLGQYDALTGLPNRTLFFGVLQHTLNVAKRNKSALALLYVDLDRFKSINDNFGQAVGNKLLREVADTLRERVRDSDVLAHLGGDDFVILLPSLAQEDDVQLVAEKVRQAFARDYAISNRHISITASIGVARFPRDARTAESLVNAAARATLLAKQQGRDTIQIGPEPLGEAEKADPG